MVLRPSVGSAVPDNHAKSHESNGDDAIKVNELLNFDTHVQEPISSGRAKLDQKAGVRMSSSVPTDYEPSTVWLEELGEEAGGAQVRVRTVGGTGWQTLFPETLVGNILTSDGRSLAQVLEDIRQRPGRAPELELDEAGNLYLIHEEDE